MPELERLIKKINTKFRLKKEFFDYSNLSFNTKIQAARSMAKYLEKPELQHVIGVLKYAMNLYETEDNVRIAAKMFSDNRDLPGVMGLVQIVHDSIAAGDIGRLNGIQQMFDDEKLVKRLRLYKEHKYVDKIVYELGRISKTDPVDSSQDIAEIFLSDPTTKDALFRCGEEENKCLIGTMFSMWVDSHDFIKIFKKYGEYSTVVAKVVNEHQYGDTMANDYTELSEDRAVEKIKNAKNPEEAILQILEGRYSTFRELVGEYDLSYEDFDVVKKTHKMIWNIHKERKEENRKIIREGFYKELRRAMDQGDISKNLRQYCSEVQQRLKENYLELMYVGS